jgi:putative resolvase
VERFFELREIERRQDLSAVFVPFLCHAVDVDAGGSRVPVVPRHIKFLLKNVFICDHICQMKLSEWAKKQGVSYRTVLRWFHGGTLPVEAEQMYTGTIIVKVETVLEHKKTALYARVSSSDQKPNLDSQVVRLTQFAVEQKLSIEEVITEIGWAMNGKRPKLLKLLRDQSVKIIVVEHRDRLIRFGFEYLEASLAAQGRKILVVDPAEVKDDLIRDMTEVLTSFCARLYGKRAARRKAEKAIKATQGCDIVMA